MPYVQADVDELERTYAAGERRVRTADGRELELRDISEYERLRALMLRDVLDSAGTPPTRLVRVGVRSGVTGGCW